MIYSKSYVPIKYTYGPNFKVEEKEYVKHVQKRVGCCLWNLKEKEKACSGKGKLTNAIIDKLQKILWYCCLPK